jgi:hypothetical protein
MNNFPALVLDNFYEKPDVVRDIALSLEYEDHSNGRYPGVRTKDLKEVHPKLYDLLIGKLLLLYYDIKDEPVEIDISVYFQKIEPFHEDPNHILNKGWVHRDHESIAAGIIYLNKEVDSHCGTSIFKLKPENSIYTYDELTDINFINPKISFFKEGNIDPDYENNLNKNNNLFEETIRVNNAYNRLMFYDSNSFHAVNSYGVTKEPFRLTQVFFINKLNKTHPSMRSRKIYIK